MLNNIKRNERGFTIVELLIVIVVIAILAAISIVAYNGIQARSKTSAAAQSASTAVKKAEAYNAETSGYPTSSAALTGASSSTTYYLTGVTVSGTALNAPTDPATLNFYRCGTNASAAATSLATVTVVTGGQFRHWDYQAGNTVITSFGQTSGNSPAGYNVTCYLGT